MSIGGEKAKDDVARLLIRSKAIGPQDTRY